MMGNGWGMGWMWVVWPLMILALALLVVLLVRGTIGGTSGNGSEPAPPGRDGSGRTRARQILDERYARGELTDEEYQEHVRHLRVEPDR